MQSAVVRFAHVGTFLLLPLLSSNCGGEPVCGGPTATCLAGPQPSAVPTKTVSFEGYGWFLSEGIDGQTQAVGASLVPLPEPRGQSQEGFRLQDAHEGLTTHVHSLFFHEQFDEMRFWARKASPGAVEGTIVLTDIETETPSSRFTFEVTDEWQLVVAPFSGFAPAPGPAPRRGTNGSLVYLSVGSGGGTEPLDVYIDDLSFACLSPDKAANCDSWQF